MDFLQIMKPPAAMDFSATNVADTWTKWRSRFENYFIAAELKNKPKAVQVAILLQLAGPDALDIFNTFQFGDGESKENYETVLEKFDGYSKPRKNTVYERYRFWKRDQGDESIDQWVLELRSRAKTCEFGDQKEFMIRDKIVFGINDERVKERLLREADLDLRKALDICRAAESSKQQLASMSDNTSQSQINAVGTKKGGHAYGGARGKDTGQRDSGKHENGQRRQHKKCGYCGNKHRPKKCPAYGKTCAKCQGKNHFAVVCRGGARNGNGYGNGHIHVLEQNDDGSFDIQNGDDLLIEAIYIGKVAATESKWQEKLTVNGNHCVNFKLDTGAHANILPLKTFKTVCSVDKKLKATSTVLTAFGGEKIKPQGSINLQVSTSQDNYDLNFYITDRSEIPLLGYEACEKLGLIKRVSVDIVSTPEKPLTKETLLQEYHDNFTGCGKYAKEYHIELKPEVAPVIQTPRRIPYAKHDKLKQTLDRLQAQGIVADVNKPTDWVSNLVIVEKKDKSFRLCLDPKPLNTAIKREYYTIPTPADVYSQLSGKKLYTIFDMRDAYWHVPLSEESSYYTTFHTPWGRKRFMRMPFGISSASEVLQERNSQAFGDIQGVHFVADDTIIAAEDEITHDKIIRQVMQRARERNVKFNKDKVQFKVKTVLYMGNVLTPEGMRADEKKIEAIVNMPTPEDKQALMRLLGMVKYLAQYIPNESVITAPLRELLKQHVPWHWEHEHEKALDQVKQMLTSTPVLQYYDVKKQVTVQTDASQSGLGCCIMQDGRPVAYASRSMTDCEKNYAQIEKEMLAICYACHKYHQFLYGKTVEVHTDHRPLEMIFRKPLARAPPRLQRMLLKLQRYNLVVRYVPARCIPLADTLSRAYLPVTKDDYDAQLEQDVEIMVHTLIDSLPVTTAKRQELRKATEDDVTLQAVRQRIKNGWPVSIKKLAPNERVYWNVRDELHEADGLVLMGDRIVIPEKLRKLMLEIVHESHLGADKCKARARTAIYWPGVNKDIEQVVANCSICLKHRKAQCKEPMLPHPVPDRPWQRLAADIMTMQGVDYLVVVDYFSKYPEVTPIPDKTSMSVVSRFKEIFARHGIPEQLISDNMPFASRHFKEFAKEWGFTLTTSSPTYPQSNGMSERCVQTIKQLFRKAGEAGKDPYIALLEYRNSPISGLQHSPAQLLMSRMLRSKLPTASRLLKPHVVNTKGKLQIRQQLQKAYYDKSAHPLPSLKQGDAIRIRRGQTWETGIVIGKATTPRSYIVSSQGTTYRRNRKHLVRTGERTPSVLPWPDYTSDPLPAQPTQPPAPLPAQPTQPPAQPQTCTQATSTARQPAMPAPDATTTPLTEAVPTEDASATPHKVTARGRIIKPPKRLDDYVTQTKC